MAAKRRSKVGAIGDWMEARDLPDADGESFRSWFAETSGAGEKEWITVPAFLNTIARALGSPAALRT